MKKILTFLIVTAFYSQTYSQQEIKIYTSDIDNFWAAFDKIQKTKNEADKYKIINELYIKKASKGLKAFMEKRDYTDSVYVNSIENLPKFWNSIRKQTLDIKSKNRQIKRSIHRLKKIYPELKPGDIYFTIGGLRSGGTIDGNMVLIGSEIMEGNPQTDVSEINSDWLKNQFKQKQYNDIVYLTTHEYVHTQQKDGFVNVLGHSIREGSCDFIAELVLNKPIKTTYIEYGNNNFEKVKEDFLIEMFSDRTDKWLYNGTKSDNPDLGYFIGYAICKAYYKNSKNKNHAVKEIIELDYSNERAIDEFLEKSKFFTNGFKKKELIENYNKLLPRVVKIEPLENNAKNISPQIKQIKITFSKEMKDVSFDMSTKGREHFPLSKIIGYENNQRTIVLETAALKPNTEYDFYINNKNTESRDGYKFYTEKFPIHFKTE